MISMRLSCEASQGEDATAHGAPAILEASMIDFPVLVDARSPRRDDSGRPLPTANPCGVGASTANHIGREPAKTALADVPGMRHYANQYGAIGAAISALP
jgi:hypothetical protein